MKVQTVIDELTPQMAKSFRNRTGVKQFIEKYSDKDTDEIDWVPFCEDVKKYGCFMFGFTLIRKLLHDGLYIGSYKDDLYSRLEDYSIIGKQRTTSLKDIMCGDRISQQIIFPNEKKSALQCYSFAYVSTDNVFVIHIIELYLREAKTHGRNCQRNIINEFGRSLGKYDSHITSVTDFTASTMFAQTDYYRTHFRDDEELRTMSIRFVINFYRWLVRSNPEHNYFENEFHMSDRLLFNKRLSELIERDFYFTTLNPANIPYGKERVCFIMKGFDGESTRITNEDFVTIDFSGLSNTFYRDLLIEFIVTSPSASAIKWVGIPAYIREAMEKIYIAKQSPSYPNRRLDYLTNQEAVFIRRVFDAQEISIRTKNNKIGSVRRFLSFCVDKHAIEVDDLFFDYLVQYEEPNKNTAKTVPDNALAKLSKYFAEQSKENLFYKEMFVIFHLAIQTEFRISQICHLQVDCIRPTIKPNQF